MGLSESSLKVQVHVSDASQKLSRFGGRRPRGKLSRPSVSFRKHLSLKGASATKLLYM